MRALRLGAAALNQIPMDWRGNRLRISEAITQAKAAGVSVLCLPELAISGYGCEDAFHGLGVCYRSLDMLVELLPETAGMIVAIGLPVLFRGAVYNAVACCVDGRCAGLYAKQHLAGDGLHYEPRWFQPWPAGKRVTFSAGPITCPLGEVYLDCAGLRIGVEICEDAWVADRAAGRLAARALDIVLNPSASHFAFGKSRIRERIVAESSRTLGVSYVYANLLGNEAGRVVYDGGALIASEGEIIAAGQRLAFVDRQLTTAVVDVDATRLVRSRQTSFVTAVDDELGACVVDGWAPPPVTLAREPLPDLGWEGAADRKEEEFGRAVALALCDYLRKSRSRGVVVSLSGGADSAAVACLARLAWDLGVQTHGESAFLQRMHLAPGTGFADFCTCVYQATANSGPVTEAAARELATGIGATFHRIDVEDLVSGYRQRIEGMLERPLDWGRDDIALQNIQARVRAPSVWMLTNCLGFLLLSTSNRSEAAVGYATMDGDTCGSLSPIAGIDKAFLRKWLVWFQNTGCFGLAPQPALAGVTAQVPTAELRPRSAGQTDEDDLMPYPVLDAIERMAIRDKRPPRDCLALLRLDFPDYDGDTLRAWVKRFFQLWCRNQWKRERYAPSFHLDDENLDPKTWCRFPILSGGFAAELDELDEESLP